MKILVINKLLSYHYILIKLFNSKVYMLTEFISFKSKGFFSNKTHVLIKEIYFKFRRLVLKFYIKNVIILRKLTFIFEQRQNKNLDIKL